MESLDSGTLSVTLLGIEFDLSVASFEDDADNSLSAIEFFDRFVVGNYIKIEGDYCSSVFD